MGMSAGIVGTLIAVSKIFDGITDIFFGSMIDKTHSKFGKARPWMLYGYVGCAITLISIFAIPVSMGSFAQYAWFFISYTLLNSVFYTANNIAYSALTALVTKNSKERVQMGSYRFIFAFATSLLIQSVTLKFVSVMGGGASGWRTVTIIYAIIGLIVNTISTLSVKELSDEELAEGENANEEDQKYGIIEALKILIHNKYYMMICGTYILQQIYGAMINVGVYYATYVLFNENMYGVFSWFINIPLIIALLFTPSLVQKWKGMYKLNKYSYMLATVGRLLVVVAGYLGSVPLMLAFTALAALGQGPWQGDMNAVIASCSEYTWLTKQKRVDGTMYSCTSLGVKIGGGLGTAIAGWLLEWSGYNGSLAVQPDSCINMLHFMYLWIPFILDLVITIILSRMNVEKANDELKAKCKSDESGIQQFILGGNDYEVSI
ncbi:MAG: glycoside-pentoside-hexuronide (GPH):cation symporter, partial [Oscillospiraceae bacterium]|nr:glycoside-pentoside-hexuronide (GPH):cation symporter [Oscillospiraceae bacterium]